MCLNQCVQLHVRCRRYPPCKMYSQWFPYHTPIFSAIRRAVIEIREGSAHVRVYPTVNLENALLMGLIGKRLSNWSQRHTKFQHNPSGRFRDTKNGCTRAHVHLTPPQTFVKRLANGFLMIHQISAQSAWPFPRYGKGGTSARADVPYPRLQ